MTVRFGPFEFDSDSRQLARSGTEIHLTPKAFDLLTLLVGESPRVVAKRELHERLWPGTFVSDATLVGLVKELRRALGDRDASTPFLRTVHGVGYAFAAPVERAVARGAVSRWVVAGGRRVALKEGENLIGRDPAAVIVLDVAGVSRRHAQITVTDRDAVLNDMGSKNGTRVGDTRVTGTIVLHDGDQIQIGPVLVIYHASSTGISTDTVVPP